MQIDVLLDPFDARWPDVLGAARAAEDAGFGGVWTWDHLAGRVHGARHVLECWTVLSALASVTEQVALGPLVLNTANRDPGTLAVAAATLQHVSGGRLLLGLGAGGGRSTPYALEQLVLGRSVGDDATRRRLLDAVVGELRRTWADRANGFLGPEPPPPIVVGAFGPKMAALAGRVGDGINLPASARDLPALVATAREHHDGTGFLVTAFTGYDPGWLQPGPRRDRLAAQGVERLVLLVRPPYRELAGARLA